MVIEEGGKRASILQKGAIGARGRERFPREVEIGMMGIDAGMELRHVGEIICGHRGLGMRL